MPRWCGRGEWATTPPMPIHRTKPGYYLEFFPNCVTQKGLQGKAAIRVVFLFRYINHAILSDAPQFRAEVPLAIQRTVPRL